jgi:MFS family permease
MKSKVITMSEPATAAAASGLLLKFGAAAGAGIAGAVIMAAVDPPKTRREMFAQAAVAGVGSIVFGPLAVKVADHYFDFIDLSKAATVGDYFEWAVPVYFLVGACSWAAFGAIARIRNILRDKAVEKAAKYID